MLVRQGAHRYVRTVYTRVASAFENAAGTDLGNVVFWHVVLRLCLADMGVVEQGHKDASSNQVTKQSGTEKGGCV